MTRGSSYGTGTAAAPRPTFAEVVEQWKRASKNQIAVGKNRESSHATDLERLKPLLETFAHVELPQINELNWGEYLKRRIETDGYAPGTVQGEATVMRKVLTFAERIHPTWFRAPKLPGVGIEEDDERRLSEAELASIIDVAERPYRALFWLYAEAGLRKSEALKLTWAQLDLANRRVFIRKTKRGALKTRASTRTVAFSRGLGDELSAMRAARAAFGDPSDDDLVFEGREAGKPLANVKRAFDRAAKRMAWDEGQSKIRLSPQRLRRAYITALRNRDVGDFIVKRVAGHSPTSEVTGKHYARLNEEGLRKAVLELPVRSTGVATLSRARSN